MAQSKAPYRKSIWDTDGAYKLSGVVLDDEALKIIERLSSVDAAKKNVRPIPVASLLQISSEARKMPKAKDATIKDIENYLHTLDNIRGAGIPTLICMLSVESNGDYSPINRKFDLGLYRRRKISKRELKELNRKVINKFSEIYVAKVDPAWHESRSTRTPKEGDNYWGRGGKDED